VPNFVSVATSITELAHGEKSRRHTQSIIHFSHSFTQPAYLMSREPTEALRKNKCPPKQKKAIASSCLVLAMPVAVTKMQSCLRGTLLCCARYIIHRGGSSSMLCKLYFSSSSAVSSAFSALCAFYARIQRLGIILTP